jgi:hypothetical protein
MQKIPAREIRPGDVLYFLGRPHLIAEVEPYDGPFDFIIGIARDESGWGISLEDCADYDVARLQDCRDCGESFPYDPEADRCSSCVAAMVPESVA